MISFPTGLANLGAALLVVLSLPGIRGGDLRGDSDPAFEDPDYVAVRDQRRRLQAEHAGLIDALRGDAEFGTLPPRGRIAALDELMRLEEPRIAELEAADAALTAFERSVASKPTNPNEPTDKLDRINRELAEGLSAARSGAATPRERIAATERFFAGKAATLTARDELDRRRWLEEAARTQSDPGVATAGVDDPTARLAVDIKTIRRAATSPRELIRLIDERLAEGGGLPAGAMD